MSSFGIFIIILVVVAGALGWRSGIMMQLKKLVGILLGIAACRIAGPTITSVVCSDTTGSDTVLYTILVYVILFVAVYAGVSIVLSVSRKILKAVHLGIIDKIAGAIFRMVEWLLLLSLALNLWVAIFPDTSLVGDGTFDRILWFGPNILGTDTAIKLKSVVNTVVLG